MPKVLGIVLAGGEGKRLMPLTLDRAKPAVPFGGSYRLIDFALSNLVNAGYLQLRRADAVQVALARPAHLGDLADVDAARQLRHPGAGPAAARSAVVPRQRRRDLPVDEPDQRRAARTSSWCSAPTTSTAWTPRRWSQAHVESGRGRHRRGHPGAAQGGLAVRGDQGRRRRRHDRGVPREAGRPAGPRGLPRRGRSRRWATTSSPPTCSSTRWRRTRPTRTPATTWAATSSRCSSREQQAASTTSSDNVVPGATDARPRLLARRRDARLATTRRTWTWCRSSRSSTSTTPTGRSSPRTRSCPARSSSRTPSPATRSSAAARSCPAPTWTAP